MKQPRSVIEITKALVLVAKFNPYHDKLGRFTSKGKANFVSTSMKAGTGKIVPYTPGMKKESAKSTAKTLDIKALKEAAKAHPIPTEAAQHKALDQVKGLPKLQGSEKQVSWAGDIRRQVAKEVGVLIPKIKEEAIDAVQSAVDSIFSNVEAKWWITHKDDDAKKLIQQALAK